MPESFCQDGVAVLTPPLPESNSQRSPSEIPSNSDLQTYNSRALSDENNYALAEVERGIAAQTQEDVGIPPHSNGTREGGKPDNGRAKNGATSASVPASPEMLPQAQDAEGDDDEEDALLEAAIVHYGTRYREHHGRDHPRLKRAQRHRVLGVLGAAFDEYGVTDEETALAFVDIYWEQGIVTDGNLNAFAQEDNLARLAFEVEKAGWDVTIAERYEIGCRLAANRKTTQETPSATRASPTGRDVAHKIRRGG